MPKPNKENIITDILVQLEKGIERGKALATIGKKWQTSQRTFDRHWKTANERYAGNQEATQKALAEQRTDIEKERLKKAILSKDDALAILSKIGTGNATKIDGAILVPTFNERTNAIKTMADLQGWKAPTKTDITTGGEKLNNSKFDPSKFTLEELKKFDSGYTDDGDDDK